VVALAAVLSGCVGTGSSTLGSRANAGQAIGSVSASVSDSAPSQNGYVTAYATVLDKAGKAIAGVPVSFTWASRTTTHVAHAVTDASGIASCTQSIPASATIGYAWTIDVSASYKGQTRQASTGFAPQ
jgi:hypothetical protein